MVAECRIIGVIKNPAQNFPPPFPPCIPLCTQWLILVPHIKSRAVKSVLTTEYTEVCTEVKGNSAI